MLNEKVTEPTPNQHYKLVNFAVECTCGKDYKFTTLDMVINCTCGKVVKLSESLKLLLIRDGDARPIDSDSSKDSSSSIS
jgi:hypothetical protein